MLKDVQRFYSEVRAEFAKVVWPSYDELIGSTIVVLVLVVAFSIYLGATDWVFYHLAQKIFNA